MNRVARFTLARLRPQVGPGPKNLNIRRSEIKCLQMPRNVNSGLGLKLKNKEREISGIHVKPTDKL